MPDLIWRLAGHFYGGEILCKIVKFSQVSQTEHVSCLLQYIFVLKFHVSIYSQVCIEVVPYTSGKILSARLMFLFFLAVCLNISTVITIKILTNSNQQTQSYKFISHIAAFFSVVLITDMLEICLQTSYNQSVQLILKSYLPVVYGTPSIVNNWESICASYS